MKLKLFCVLVAGSAFACAQPQATVNQPVVLEVRFVDTTPGSDTIWRPLRGGFDTIALSPDAIFTGADLSEVRADTSRHWSLLSPPYRPSMKLRFA
jgi:hypothetical protein